MVIRKFGVGDILRTEGTEKKKASKAQPLSAEQIAAIEAEGDERAPRS